jgi:hypothetical protein
MLKERLRVSTISLRLRCIRSECRRAHRKKKEVRHECSYSSLSHMPNGVHRDNFLTLWICLGYMASNGRMITNKELGGIWEEVVARYSNTHTHGLGEETQKLRQTSDVMASLPECEDCKCNEHGQTFIYIPKSKGLAFTGPILTTLAITQ